MKKILKKIETKTIYLTEGGLQKIAWLCKEWEIINLWSPTTQEFINTIEEYTDSYRAVIVTPRSLKTDEEDKVYGLPTNPYLFVNDLTYVFVSLDTSPEVFDLEIEKEQVKKLKNKLETNLNGLSYKRLTLNSKYYDLTQDELISKLLNTENKNLLERYKEYPFELYKFLKCPEIVPTEDIETETVSSLVNKLGTLDGVRVWSELPNQEVMASFIVKTTVEGKSIPFIVKSLCSVGKKTTYECIYGYKELPAPFNQDIYLYLKPILNKLSNISVDRAKLYLGLFSRFALAVSVNAEGWNCGFKKQISSKGNEYLVCRLSEQSKLLWHKYISRT